ncbi:hypothetical protein [Hymenobacter profundi]|uniref:Uncharacterized protein n=1 Tax=Hymenobacter profundi TaxID=1982110 RepID=A0ABS6WUM8_9BACT|nr:hypothetical protein [Hymenobacter profundi]MBW3127275.1 hypothetical protein [Hymenobacter profundi]
MCKSLAPVCRGLLRPVPGSPLGPATYLLLFRRPGCPHALLLLGQRAECLRAALRETIRDIHHSQDCHEHPTGAADPEEGGEAFYEPPPAWAPEDFYDDTDY